jgi:hypothetical protein
MKAKKYKAGGLVKGWKKEALADLRKFTGTKDLKPLPYSIDGVSDDEVMMASNGSEEYIVFQDSYLADDAATAYVEEMIDSEPESFNSNFLNPFIYVTDTDKRLIADEQADFEIEDLSEDEILERSGLDDLEEATEKIRKEVYDDWYNGLDGNPVEFLTEDLGIYSKEDLKNISFLQIDSRKAAEEAVNLDGSQHFLATYDGELMELKNGYVAFRTN